MNLLDEAKKYEGVREKDGAESDPQIVGWIKDNPHDKLNDEVPWCSAFVNFICKECGVERSRSNRARRWLNFGNSVTIEDAEEGDVVVFKVKKDDPGVDDTDSHGHVAFFVRYDSVKKRIYVFGGNQNNEVCEKDYPDALLLDIRRLAREP